MAGSQTAGTTVSTGASGDLSSRDLPGYRPGNARAWIWKAESGATARCLQIGTLSPVRNLPSRQFSARGDLVAQTVSSDVVVFSNSGEALRAARALGSQRGAQCLQGPFRHALAPETSADHLRLAQVVQATALPGAPAGAAASFGYRMAISATPRSPSQHAFTIYLDLYGFVVGRQLVELETSSVRQLFPAHTEKRLLSLLEARAGEVPAPSAA